MEYNSFVEFPPTWNIILASLGESLPISIFSFTAKHEIVLAYYTGVVGVLTPPIKKGETKFLYQIYLKNLKHITYEKKFTKFCLGLTSKILKYTISRF